MMLTIVVLRDMIRVHTRVWSCIAVIITIANMLGIIVVILGVNGPLMDIETAAVAASPLTGVFVAAMMIQTVSSTKHLVILAYEAIDVICREYVHNIANHGHEKFCGLDY